MSYPHNEIDQKWQTKWKEKDCFLAQDDDSRPKYYALDMFPYPSGKGLHVGHIASYTPTDIMSRFKRSQGFNVLHPMGYDAFGLPAEQYAIQTGVHPNETTQKAITSFRKTLESFGYSFDWSREVATCDPSFYKWTQFIFKKLFEKGLAYQKEVPVNWCPALKTVLANEEVVDGKSERGNHPVIRKPMKQWMLKITDYAERLINDLDKIDWPERTKEGQRHWIGKSEGAEVDFQIQDHKDLKLRVFTTRPDTLFGATFMVMAPEHPWVQQIVGQDEKEAVNHYIQQTLSKSDVDRQANTQKTGCFTGAYAINPVNQQPLPIWIADYVLMDYGTGAIMAVPAHDERDFDFATEYSLPITRVLHSDTELPFIGDGPHVNSDFLDGLNKEDAIQKVIEHLESSGLGLKKTQYKLRDWLFSRQRYWGEPFPVVHYDNGDVGLIPDEELPVVLPEVADYSPSETGEPPLARSQEFVNYQNKGRRETDTMPGSAGSSWYFLRYIDPHNNKDLVSFEKQKYWMPVDLYVGGAEHTVGHLLYARFWQKVLFDCGLVSHDEPFKKLAHQGVVMGTDGVRMSKSRGNVINPDDVKKDYGADALRCYISFLGPFDKDKPWSSSGIDGVKRFLDRFWRLAVNDEGQCITQKIDPSDTLLKLTHKTIKKVTEDYEAMSFNTAISAMMVLVNEMYKQKSHNHWVLKTLAQLLMPIAPHVSEEVWENLEETGFVSLAQWPTFDPQFVKEDNVTIGVQVNGKMRGKLELNVEESEDGAVAEAKKLHGVSQAIEGKSLVKVIYRPGKILNLIAK